MKSSRFLDLSSIRIAIAVRTAIIVVGGGLAIGTALPPPAWSSPEVEAVPKGPTAPPASIPAIDIERTCRRDLRQPLVDAPPPPVGPVPETPISVRLLGTAVESERQFGIFALANNASVLKEVGALVDGYEVVSVQRGIARLRRGDRIVELRVPWYDQLADERAP